MTNSLYEQLKDDLGYLGLTARPSASPPWPKRPRPRSGATSSSWPGWWVSRHRPRSTGSWPHDCASPASRSAGRSPTSTSSSSPAWTESWSTTWPRSGSSRRTGRSCSSASPGAARPIWPWLWPPPPSRPGIGATSPPLTTWSTPWSRPSGKGPWPPSSRPSPPRACWSSTTSGCCPSNGAEPASSSTW